MSANSTSASWIKKNVPLRWAEGYQLIGDAPIQEDHFAINSDRGIFLLADGFGGSPGKTAAHITIHSVQQFLESEAGDLDATLPFELRPYYSLSGNVLFNAVSFANEKLSNQFENKNWMNTGGASLIAGYLEGRLLSIASVGSCSLHLFRKGRKKEIVSPRTLARQMDPFEEGSLIEKAIPLMSLGTAKQLEPVITEIEIFSGDQLCFQTTAVPPAFMNEFFGVKSPKELSYWMNHQSNHQRNSLNASWLWVSF